ncbi:MAG: CsbD family protein [Actinomycetota bacterium]|nr:CsbD family protein [Actinomycetota bacterium]
MSESTGPSSPVERVVEKVKGTAKEAAGTITGNEELRREGEEQEQAAMRGEGWEQESEQHGIPDYPKRAVPPDEPR